MKEQDRRKQECSGWDSNTIAEEFQKIAVTTTTNTNINTNIPSDLTLSTMMSIGTWNDHQAELEKQQQKEFEISDEDIVSHEPSTDINYVSSFGNTSTTTTITTSTISTSTDYETDNNPKCEFIGGDDRSPDESTTSTSVSTTTNLVNLSQEYHLKWIKWKGIDSGSDSGGNSSCGGGTTSAVGEIEKCPIVTQNSNGPCPLLAIMNVLLLRKNITFPPMIEIITAEQLMDYLCEFIVSNVPTVCIFDLIY